MKANAWVMALAVAGFSCTENFMAPEKTSVPAQDDGQVEQSPEGDAVFAEPIAMGNGNDDPQMTVTLPTAIDGVNLTFQWACSFEEEEEGEEQALLSEPTAQGFILDVTCQMVYGQSVSADGAGSRSRSNMPVPGSPVTELPPEVKLDIAEPKIVSGGDSQAAIFNTETKATRITFSVRAVKHAALTVELNSTITDASGQSFPLNTKSVQLISSVVRGPGGYLALIDAASTIKPMSQQNAMDACAMRGSLWYLWSPNEVSYAEVDLTNPEWSQASVIIDKSPDASNPEDPLAANSLLHSWQAPSIDLFGAAQTLLGAGKNQLSQLDGRVGVPAVKSISDAMPATRALMSWSTALTTNDWFPAMIYRSNHRPMVLPAQQTSFRTTWLNPDNAASARYGIAAAQTWKTEDGVTALASRTTLFLPQNTALPSRCARTGLPRIEAVPHRVDTCASGFSFHVGAVDSSLAFYAVAGDAPCHSPKVVPSDLVTVTASESGVTPGKWLVLSPSPEVICTNYCGKGGRGADEGPRAYRVTICARPTRSTTGGTKVGSFLFQTMPAVVDKASAGGDDVQEAVGGDGFTSTDVPYCSSVD